MKTKILVSKTIIQRSGLIRTALTSLLQLVSIMHFNWAKVKRKLTVIPNHHFVSRISRSLTPTNYCEYVCFMNHLYNTDSSSEFPWELFCDFITQLKYLKPLLSTNWEVWLILIEGYMKNFLLFFLHLP